MPRTATYSKRQLTSVVMVKSTQAWRDWLDKFAESTRLPKQVLIDQSLEAFAKTRHFDRPPVRLATRPENEGE